MEAQLNSLGPEISFVRLWAELDRRLHRSLTDSMFTLVERELLLDAVQTKRKINNK